MKIVLAVLVLMPSFARASSYPSDRPCVTDGCTPDRPGPKPLPWPKPRPKAWDADSLNGLFTGSAPKEKGAESEPVAAGDWTVEERHGASLSMPTFAPQGEKQLPLVESARIVKVNSTKVVGEAIVGVIVEKVIKEANDAATRYVERDQTKESEQKYHGCRPKGTCDK